MRGGIMGDARTSGPVLVPNPIKKLAPHRTKPRSWDISGRAVYLLIRHIARVARYVLRTALPRYHRQNQRRHSPLPSVFSLFLFYLPRILLHRDSNIHISTLFTYCELQWPWNLENTLCGSAQRKFKNHLVSVTDFNINVRAALWAIQKKKFNRYIIYLFYIRLDCSRPINNKI